MTPTLPPTFSEAALWRLIDCYRSPRETDGASAMDVWIGMVTEATTDPGMHIAVVEFNELLGAHYHDDDLAVLRVVGLAGLIELGVRAAYIDLGELHNAEQLLSAREALGTFEKELLQGAKRTQLGLLRDLLRRYERQDYRVETRDDAAFGMFEAYVDLTESVLNDRACRRFIEETHGVPTLRRLDDAMLLSPRHFADAVATGKVGALESPEVAGGLATLRYLDRLMSIVAQLDSSTALHDGIVRHARWARDAQRLRIRFERWAEAMAEWSDSGIDAEGMTRWSEYRSRVFWPLIRDQDRVAPPEPDTAPEVVDVSTAPEPATRTAQEEAGQLAAEGRVGAARVRLREEASSRFERLWSQSGTDWVDEVENLVQVCTALAELGDIDSAAAYVTPLLGAIASRVGTQYQVYADAAGIVARARLSVASAAGESALGADDDQPRRPRAQYGAEAEQEPRRRPREIGE